MQLCTLARHHVPPPPGSRDSLKPICNRLFFLPNKRRERGGREGGREGGSEGGREREGGERERETEDKTVDRQADRFADRKSE